MKKPLMSTSDLVPKDMCVRACVRVYTHTHTHGDTIQSYRKRRASKMAQCVKEPSSELGDLSLTPTTCRVEESQTLW